MELFACVIIIMFKLKLNTTKTARLGFHQPTNDYRIVRVVYAGGAEVNYFPTVAVFSLRMNNWREIQSPSVSNVPASDIGTTVGNFVYWLDRAVTETRVEQVGIVSFDFNNEVLGQVQLPDDVRYCLGDFVCFDLMKFEDSLCVFVSNPNTESDGSLHHHCCIWLMKLEGGIVSWTIRFKVVLNENAWPLDITRSGTLVMSSLSGPCTVNTSFIESLLLLEGGDELLKSA